MKKFSFVVLLALLVNPGIVAQESFLTPNDGLTTSIPFEGLYSALEISNNTLYALEADTVYFIDLISGSMIKKLGSPDPSYVGFPSFITISPNATDVWVGYTTADNSDDRIYYINTTDNIWNHVATFPANFDLAFWNGQAIVTGLNSSVWSDPTGIWLLDDSGQDKHRLLIALDGYSAGLDIDNAGNIYYASSYFSDNALLKWTTDDITAVKESANDTLKAENATVLTNLPAGSYDIDLDRVGNIVFSCNNFIENFIGIWDGNDSYDTLATTDFFLTHLSTWGNISLEDPGNEVYAMAYGSEIAEVHFESLVSGQQIAAIIEYTPAPGQFINTAAGNPSAAESLTNENGGLISLGGYGGYIILKLSESIENNPDNPYGVDFTIFGNALSFWSEPGIVEVMKDENGNGLADETWYELAGSDHNFSGTIPDYQVSYTNPNSEVAADIHWSDNQGVTGVIKKNVFQSQPYYPDPSVFYSIGETKCDFAGRRILPVLDFSNPVQAVSHRRSFGYADNNMRIDPANPLPDNPYTSEIENSGGDGMDISWAVDESGQYIDLDEVDFLRIYTAVNADGGAIGEISTEISQVVDIEPASGYPIPEKFIAVKGLPSKIIPEAYELEYSVFFQGRYKNDETVTWSVDGVRSYIDGNEYLLAEGEEKLTLTATLDSDPEISTTFSTEVYTPVDVSRIKEAKIEIYPNPTSDILNINQLAQGTIELISSEGKVIFSKEATGSLQQVDVSEYPSGIYLLRYRDKHRIESHKILIY